MGFFTLYRLENQIFSIKSIFFIFLRNLFLIHVSIEQIPQTMKLEYSILEHLSNNDNGKFVDVTFIEDDYVSIGKALAELQGRNMILVDKTSSRDFEAFGIGNDRKKALKAKIKMNGRIYYHSLKSKNSKNDSGDKRKNLWSLSYFF